jgi:hypothetical protein
LENEILLFSYFKGHGDGLHVAFSTDAYNWQSLNDDNVLLTPNAGVERIMRDPCLIYGKEGKFHLVWTSGWTEPGFGYATSEDLITWSSQKYLAVMEHEPHARNCWAPEIFYYKKNEEYIIYWSTTIDGKFPETQPYGDDGYNHRIYYVTTKDFATFSETRLLYDGGFNVIDGHIATDSERYFLFMKNETLTPPEKNIRIAFGNDPFSFGRAAEPITPNHYWAEGPTAIKYNDAWIVYFDKYKTNQIGAVRSHDLAIWEDISHLITFPRCAQHGFISRAPADKIAHLLHKTQAYTSFIPNR